MKSFILVLFAFFSLHAFSQAKANFELDFSEVVDISEPPIVLPDEVIEKFAKENNIEKDQVKFKVIRRQENVKVNTVIRDETFISQVLPLSIHSTEKEKKEKEEK